ncbi:MAG: hypothetical protein AAGA96_17445 [Verrucomicrobiota bacterium]
MIEILEQIKAKILELDSDINFSPGLSSDEIRERFNSASFSAPDSLVEFYTWSSGAPHPALIELLPGGFFWSIDQAISDLSSQSLYKDAGESFWNSIRVLTDHSDGGFSVLSAAEGGAIVHRCIHAPREIFLPSMEQLVNLSLRCYSNGVFSISDGMIEANFDRYWEILVSSALNTFN